MELLKFSDLCYFYLAVKISTFATRMRLSFSTLSSILFIIFLPFFLFFSFLRTGRTEDSKDFIATLVVYIRTHRCWREFLRCRGGHRFKYFFFFFFFFINCHVNIPFDIFIPRSFFFFPLSSLSSLAWLGLQLTKRGA